MPFCAKSEGGIQMQTVTSRFRAFVALLVVALAITFLPTGSWGATAQAATSYANRYSVVQTARKYMGRPYVFGAAGPRHFDCSGLTRYVFRLHGYYLPHSAASQARYGRSVPKYGWRYGDLIFFRNTYKYGISHVGIYAGNGRMVHAWPRGGVRVDSFTRISYFTRRYAGARRILR
jgi:cell wall-associated NlpC family hydrolase